MLIINHNYWVPRSEGGTTFPTDYSAALNPNLIPTWARGTDPAIYGWPRRIDDRGGAHVPFISDKCGSGQGGGLNSPTQASTNVDNISPNTAHFFGGRLSGVNAAFCDGHVDNRRPSQIKAVYVNSAPSYWFY